MSVQVPKLATLPLEALIVFLEQQTHGDKYEELILNEIRKRSYNDSMFLLCTKANMTLNDKLKKIYLDVICEKMPNYTGIIEVISFEESLQNMSLEQVCGLSMVKDNEIVEFLAKRELAGRTHLIEKVEKLAKREDKVYEKQKGREFYAKYKK